MLRKPLVLIGCAMTALGLIGITYNAVRPEHCRRVLSTGRVWGELWHVDGIKRLQRNAILRARGMSAKAHGIIVAL